ncbi:hypothetical protein BT69DRAFT_1318591 [Atractiella rhizophila]|nr:hypothetical protein BT69DRAFT_1318591 [Atractiella rhizophila]
MKLRVGKKMINLGRRLMRNGWNVSRGTMGQSREDDGLKVVVLRDSPETNWQDVAKDWKPFFDFFHAGFLLFFATKITYLDLEAFDPDLPLTFNFPSLRTLKVEMVFHRRGFMATIQDTFPRFAEFSALQVLELRNIDFFRGNSGLQPPTFALRSLSASTKYSQRPADASDLDLFQYLSASDSKLERLVWRTEGPFDKLNLITCSYLVFFSCTIEDFHWALPVFPPLPKLKHLEFGTSRYGIQDLPLLSTFPHLNQSRGLKSLKLTEVLIIFPPPESGFHFDATEWKCELEELEWTHPRDKFTPSDVFLSLQILCPDSSSPPLRRFKLSYLSFGDPKYNILFLSRLLYCPTSSFNPSPSSLNIFKNGWLETIQTRYLHPLLISTPTYELQGRTLYLDDGHPDSLRLFIEPLIRSIQQNTLPSLTTVRIGWTIDPDDPYQVLRGPMELSSEDYHLLQQVKHVTSEKNILFESGDVIMKAPEAVGAAAQIKDGDVGSEEYRDNENEEDDGAEEGSDYEQPDESDIDYSYLSSDESDEDASSPGSEELLKPTQSTGHSYNILFLGTGTSESIPTISCLTSNPCLCCCLAHPPSKSKFKFISKSKSKYKSKAKTEFRSKSKSEESKRPLPKPNKRRNTSALITLPSGKTVLIDCGKSFRESALEFFPKNGKSVIDAVLLTHEHADAAYGLDDLRAWTLGGAIQPSLDVYCDRKTYDALSRVFPYTIDRSASTGGGDVPQFSWHIFEADQPVHLFDSTIVPLKVEHGLSAPDSDHSSDHVDQVGENSKETMRKTPYYCLGYLIDDSIAYLSDVSQIPPQVWHRLHSSYQLTGRHLDVLVIDCLRLLPHISHYGLPQALLTSGLLHPTRTYLTGFAHRATHSQWASVAEDWGEGEWRVNGREKIRRLGEMDVLQVPPSDLGAERIKEKSRRIDKAADGAESAFVEIAREMTEKIAIENVLGDVARQVQGKVMMRQKVVGTWVRPAYDGLNVFVGVNEQGRRVWDDSPEEL